MMKRQRRDGQRFDARTCNPNTAQCQRLPEATCTCAPTCVACTCTRACPTTNMPSTTPIRCHPSEPKVCNKSRTLKFKSHPKVPPRAFPPPCTSSAASHATHPIQVPPRVFQAPPPCQALHVPQHKLRPSRPLRPSSLNVVVKRGCLATDFIYTMAQH